MAAALPRLRALAEEKGLKIHHLGAGYPHPEVTNPRGYIEHKEAFYAHRLKAEGHNDPAAVSDLLREAYSYTDTLGPAGPRAAFASVYGKDWGVVMDPDRLIPSVGASGGINLLCSLFERPGRRLAYVTDAPTYAGFLARASLCQRAEIYSVEMDGEGPVVERFRQQIRAARADGLYVPFYYTVPDGHNPAGFSFSSARRDEILEVAKEEGVLIVEDAPYVYISYVLPRERPKPFLALDPKQSVHLFTGSKIGLPGPRIGFVYSEATLMIENDEEVSLTDLLLTESSADILFHNPDALRGFEALLHDERFELRDSLWPVAQEKLVIYRENREIMMNGLERYLGEFPERFAWTYPEAGFFTVFTFLGDRVRTDDEFVARLVSEHGVVVIPMYDFYPVDARRRDPNAGFNQLRLSFCFSESEGAERIRDLTEAVKTFCHAARVESGLPGLTFAS
ncbi:MAG: PLP-dependent aminotransferase family protein [Pseudomonadales bacterium]